MEQGVYRKSFCVHWLKDMSANRKLFTIQRAAAVRLSEINRKWQYHYYESKHYSSIEQLKEYKTTKVKSLLFADT